MARIRSPERASPTAEAESRRALIEAVKHPRYEVLPLEGAADDVVAHVPPQVKVTVTASPTRGLDPTLDLAERLSGAGYAVAPHISARLVRNQDHLEELLDRLRSAGVNDLFVIAGDAREPAGDFPDAAALLSAMGGLRERFAEIGISGYPESHHLISDETTIQAMFEKESMATYIVSQICFDAEVIVTWVRRVHARGTLLPIWIGVAGTISNRRLLRIAGRVGLGDSARLLKAHGAWLRRLVRPGVYTPTRLIRELAPSIANAAARIAGLHVYTFNELARTEKWRLQLVDRLIDEDNHA